MKNRRRMVTFTRIRKVACIGAGTIGRQWAAFFASRGFEVSIHDIRPEITNSAFSEIKRDVSFLTRKKLVSSRNAKLGLSNLKACAVLEDAVKGANLIQESVYEDLALKRSVISQIERVVSSNAIIASSSGGGVLPSHIQNVMKHPERFLIVHPTAQPVYIDPVTELVPGPKTSSKLVREMKGFLESQGKIAITLKKEVEGFVANRLYFLVWREALDIVGKGVISADELDRLYCHWNMKWLAGVGPFLETHLHGGSGGSGGFKAALEHYAKQLPYLWETTATWKTVPKNVRRTALLEARRMKPVQKGSVQTLRRRRDESRVRIDHLFNSRLIDRIYVSN